MQARLARFQSYNSLSLSLVDRKCRRMLLLLDHNGYANIIFLVSRGITMLDVADKLVSRTMMIQIHSDREKQQQQQSRSRATKNDRRALGRKIERFFALFVCLLTLLVIVMFLSIYRFWLRQLLCRRKSFVVVVV